MSILQKQWKGRDCASQLMSLHRDVFFPESGCLISEPLILQLLKIDSQLLYTRRGWTGDCQEITEAALCFLEISLGLCSRTYHWPLLFTETSLTDSSASDHGFSSTSPVLDIIWNNFAKNNQAGKNNQNKELKQNMNLHCFPLKG